MKIELGGANRTHSRAKAPRAYSTPKRSFLLVAGASDLRRRRNAMSDRPLLNYFKSGQPGQSHFQRGFRYRP